MENDSVWRLTKGNPSLSAWEKYIKSVFLTTVLYSTYHDMTLAHEECFTRRRYYTNTYSYSRECSLLAGEMDDDYKVATS
jgi:hypothetical protein